MRLLQFDRDNGNEIRINPHYVVCIWPFNKNHTCIGLAMDGDEVPPIVVIGTVSDVAYELQKEDW